MLTAQILSTHACIQSCFPCFYLICPIYSLPQSCEVGSVITPVLQIGTQRCTELQRLAQGPSVGEEQRQDWAPGLFGSDGRRLGATL